MAFQMVDLSGIDNSDALESRRERLVRRVDRLFDEVEHLHSENRHLLKENKDLREELTLLRLYLEGDLPDDLKEEIKPRAALPPPAVDFFHKLPRSFNVSVYFRLAEEHGLGSARARSYLLHFIHEGMLVQRGHRVEKSGRARRIVQ